MDQFLDCVYEVVIVGYGPNGEVLSNILGKNGIKTLVIESSQEPFSIPRAAHMDDEALRILQNVGLDREIKKNSFELPVQFNRFYDQDTILHVEPQTTKLGQPRSVFYHQPTIEEIFRRGTKRYHCVDVLLYHQVVNTFYSDEALSNENNLNIVIENLYTKNKFTINTRYLIGADGASSQTRKIIGSKFIGSSGAKWCAVDMSMKADQKMSFCFQFICNPNLPMIAFPKPGNKYRMEFLVSNDYEEEFITNPKNLNYLLKKHGVEPTEVSIDRHSIYIQQYRFADKWMDDRGNIFLVGDAAHCLPPFLGLGISSGLRDSINLAWKLKLLLRNEEYFQSDQQKRRILETYQQERLPDLQAIAQNSCGVGGVLMSKSKTISLIRDIALNCLLKVPAIESFIKADGMKPRGKADSCLLDQSYKPNSLFSYLPLYLRTAYINRMDLIGLPIIQPFLSINNVTKRLDDILGDVFSILIFNFTSDDKDLLLDLNLDHEYWNVLGTNVFQVLSGTHSSTKQPIISSKIRQLDDIDDELYSYLYLQDSTKVVVVVRPDKIVYGIYHDDKLQTCFNSIQSIFKQ